MAAVAGFLNVALNTIQNILTISQTSLLVWLFSGGWLYALRLVGFIIDCKLVNFITYIYKYFTLLLEGTMFNETVTDAILGNIYLFIGVVVFFRLMMVVIKYLINPDLVSDAKTGVNALIQRAIIGFCGILFLPTIFSLAFRLQSAILEDQIVQKIILPNDIVDSVGQKINNGGKYLGTYILSGFVNPKTGASKKTKDAFKTAVKKGDLSSIDINEGGWMAAENTYEYEYFVLLSTLILAYVLWQILKYTLDLAVRSFKMLIYQILAPIAMVEYILNGSEDGVFKSWKTAVLGTYFMIFVRVMAIWFVMFVTLLMSGDLPGYINGSLLGKAAGTASGDPDYLLRAIIIIALLGFMMDLPKIVGQIFGLDLEQESSATGVLKQVGGMLKGAAIGGLAIGGAAAAGALGTAKSGLNTLSGMGPTKTGSALANKLGANKLKNGLSNNKAIKGLNALRGKVGALGNKITQSDTFKNASADMDALKASAKDANFSEHMTKASSGIIAAAMSSNQFTGSAYKGYTGQKQEQSGVDKQAAQNAEEKARHRELVDAQKRATEETVQRDIVERVIESNPAGTSRNAVAAQAQEQYFHGKLVADWSTAAGGDVKAQMSVNPPSSVAEATQVVTQVLQATASSSGINMESIPAMAKEIVLDARATAGSVDAPSFTAEVEARVSSSVTKSAEPQVQEVEQKVNQMYGTRVNNTIDDATMKVNQEIQKVNNSVEDVTQNVTQRLDKIVTNTEEMNVYAEISTEHIENIRQDISQQVDIQRDIRTNTEETNVYAELTAENTENIVNKNN